MSLLLKILGCTNSWWEFYSFFFVKGTWLKLMWGLQNIGWGWAILILWWGESIMVKSVHWVPSALKLIHSVVSNSKWSSKDKRDIIYIYIYLQCLSTNTLNLDARNSNCLFPSIPCRKCPFTNRKSLLFKFNNRGKDRPFKSSPKKERMIHSNHHVSGFMF